MNLQMDLEIVALEPQTSGLTLVEARGADGVGMMITARLAQSLEVGARMTLILSTQPAAALPSSMRERMQARISGVSASGAAASSSAAGTIGARATQSPGAGNDASSLLMSTLLGVPSHSSTTTEHNVDAEMDALLGAPRKG